MVYLVKLAEAFVSAEAESGAFSIRSSAAIWQPDSSIKPAIKPRIGFFIKILKVNGGTKLNVRLNPQSSYWHIFPSVLFTKRLCLADAWYRFSFPIFEGSRRLLWQIEFNSFLIILQIK